MSRARPITTPFGELWVDRRLDGQKATHEQLELLAANLNKEIDDLLDEVWTQKDVIAGLRQVLGQVPPQEVLDRMALARAKRLVAPECRVCDREGDSTQHHFVNKWILRELEYYEQKWSQRSDNCIPVCIDCHRDLHARDNGSHPIADLLTEEEKEFAEAALSALAEERPKLLVLIARGDDSTYETRLVRDWLAGDFRSTAPDPASSVSHLRVVA